MSSYLCPVCGYPSLIEPPWSDGAPSDEICPSCGTHFGLDDAAGGDAALREVKHAQLREAWIDAGYQWFSRTTSPPPDWDPAEQLAVFEA